MLVRIPQIVLFTCLVHAAAATPTLAQSSTSSTVKADTAARPWQVKPVGTYDLSVVVPDRNVPVTLVIADSAEHLVATITSNEDGMSHPVTASVKGVDLTLVGETPSGTLTIVLQQRDKKISGTWKIEDQSGTLTGVMRPAK